MRNADNIWGILVAVGLWVWVFTQPVPHLVPNVCAGLLFGWNATSLYKRWSA